MLAIFQCIVLWYKVYSYCCVNPCHLQNIFNFATETAHSPLSTIPGPPFCLLSGWIWLLSVSHIISVFLWLVYFTEHNVLLVHLCCISEFPSFLKLNNILFYVCNTFFFLFIHHWTLGLLPPFRRGCYECDCPNSPLCLASDSLGYAPRSVRRLLWYCGSFSLLGNHFWYFICDSSALAHGRVCPLMMDFVTSWTAIAEPMPVIFVQPALS